MLVALGTMVLGCGDDGTSAGTDAAAGGEVGSATSWASGGTKSLAASYPDPFTTPSTACVLAPTATQGPCTEAADQVRKDISEGYPGLPTRLALKVVDASCAPIAGATAKIWHTQLTGSYSGDTPNPGMCVKDQADSARHYFRGVQTTDASGRVDFDTCFPGWYSGRTIHIHFTVRRGNTAYVTSQLYWPDDLCDEIIGGEPVYSDRGQRDTKNSDDGIYSGPDYEFQWAKMSDGAMLASKKLVLRTSTGSPLCSA